MGIESARLIRYYLFGGGYQTMQMYGKFEGFPINIALFGLVR